MQDYLSGLSFPYPEGHMKGINSVSPEASILLQIEAKFLNILFSILNNL